MNILYTNEIKITDDNSKIRIEKLTISLLTRREKINEMDNGIELLKLV